MTQAATTGIMNYSGLAGSGHVFFLQVLHAVWVMLLRKFS